MVFWSNLRLTWNGCILSCILRLLLLRQLLPGPRLVAGIARMDQQSYWTPAMSFLAQYHPVVIEGMGQSDPRDPKMVAEHVHSQLQAHWANKKQTDKNIYETPKLVITQGDPRTERGISAITASVASDYLRTQRGLVCLDPHIAEDHTRDADRDNVIVTLQYTELTNLLEGLRPGCVTELEALVRTELEQKNARRREMNKPPLKDYFFDFAMLQEITKAACRAICGSITVAHTSASINDFSVTSFYTVGLEWGWIHAERDMVSYDLLDDVGA